MQRLGVTRLTAKIGMANTPSLRLFESFGFIKVRFRGYCAVGQKMLTLLPSIQKVSESSIFEEVTLEIAMADLASKFPTGAAVTSVYPHQDPVVL